MSGMKEMLGTSGVDSNQMSDVDEYRSSCIRIIQEGIFRELSDRYNRDVISPAIVANLMQDRGFCVPMLCRTDEHLMNPFQAVVHLVDVGLNSLGLRSFTERKTAPLDPVFAGVLEGELSVSEAIMVYSVVYLYSVDVAIQQSMHSRNEVTYYSGRCRIYGVRYGIPSGAIIQIGEVNVTKYANYGASKGFFGNFEFVAPTTLESMLNLTETAGRESIIKLSKKLMI